MSLNIAQSYFLDSSINSTNVELDESLLLSDEFNLSITSSNISRNFTDIESYHEADAKGYWAFVLIPFPLVAVVGNILVILSVYKERSLQTVTNYFIVSLAFADLLVAAVVMPFALYVLVNRSWELSDTLCDFYIAVDVTCSTASIFNLVAISVDRFIAVTQPIRYSKHKNSTRVWLTIVLVWLVSAAIGSPIVLGLNTSPERTPELCVFYNSDFIIYSSLSSFYIPCFIMVFLYYKIFKAIHERARRSKLRSGHTESGAYRSTGSSSLTNEPVSSQKRTDQQDPIPPGFKYTPQIIVEKDGFTTNTGSNSQEDDDEDDDDDTCNEDQPGAMTGLLSAFMTETIRIEIPINGNTDSGYGTSHVEQETQLGVDVIEVLPDSGSGDGLRKNGMLKKKIEKKKSRFNIGRRNKSNRKKRERASAKKERKATKTLAIVLGMFLMCWVPFFTCNILDAVCIKLENDDWRPGMTIFLLTTWLGYFNSCVNPVVYTIFNMEFRKAFKKLLEDSCQCRWSS